MNKKDYLSYESPVVEIIEIEAERIFAESGSDSKDMFNDSWNWGTNN